MAMALLLHGGLLGGMGGEAAGVDGSGEGAWTLATPAEGFLAASGTGELAHLLHLCLFRAFPRGAMAATNNTCRHNALPAAVSNIRMTTDDGASDTGCTRDDLCVMFEVLQGS